MEKKEFYYTSSEQQVKIHVIEWIPEGRPKAILQISHGMVEYIDRYDEFARYLCKRGYYVVGQDHLGHGESVSHEDNLGFFHETRGNEHVIGDIDLLREITREKYPEQPYYMLGHSMGSFLTRQYIQEEGEGLAGAIIMGTGHYPQIVLRGGMLLCRVIAAFRGWNYRSRLINSVGIGRYNKQFEPARTPVDWISKDEEIVDKYVNDPWCTFSFTVNGYYHLFAGMKELTQKNVRDIPKRLPLFFVSGENDPVGGFGKEVRKVYEQYQQVGIQDVSLKLYPEDRHEILNETDRQQVYRDLYQWMEEKSSM